MLTISVDAASKAGLSTESLPCPPSGYVGPAAAPAESDLLVTTPPGFTYYYVSTAPDPFATTVSTNFSGPTLIGIAYSIANSLFIDFSSGAEGWT